MTFKYMYIDSSIYTFIDLYAVSSILLHRTSKLQISNSLSGQTDCGREERWKISNEGKDDKTKTNNY